MLNIDKLKESLTSATACLARNGHCPPYEFVSEPMERQKLLTDKNGDTVDQIGFTIKLRVTILADSKSYLELVEAGGVHEAIIVLTEYAKLLASRLNQFLDGFTAVPTDFALESSPSRDPLQITGKIYIDHINLPKKPL